jgi:hypothetical protein
VLCCDGFGVLAVRFQQKLPNAPNIFVVDHGIRAFPKALVVQLDAISLATAGAPQPDVGNSFEARELAPQVSDGDLSDMPADPAHRRHTLVVREMLDPRGIHRNHGAFR